MVLFWRINCLSSLILLVSYPIIATANIEGQLYDKITKSNLVSSSTSDSALTQIEDHCEWMEKSYKCCVNLNPLLSTNETKLCMILSLLSIVTPNFKIQMTLGDRTLTTYTLGSNTPSKECLKIPLPISYFKLCLEFREVDLNPMNFHLCMDLHVKGITDLTFHFQCIDFQQSYENLI